MCIRNCAPVTRRFLIAAAFVVCGTILAPGGGLRAQAVPALENAWLRVEGLGPLVEGDAFRWNLEFAALVPGLTRIEVRDTLEGKASPVLVLEGKAIYAKGMASGQALPPERFEWIYEEPATFRWLTVRAWRGRETMLLHVPLSFSEGTKSTLRFLVRERTGYSRPPVAGLPYQMFDGRKWILVKTERSADRAQLEYSLADAEAASPERVIQIAFASASSLAAIVKERRADLQGGCDPGRWTEQLRGPAGTMDKSSDQSSEQTSGEIYYEWLGSDCAKGGYEAGSIRKTERGLLLTRYVYRPGTIPPTTRMVWRQLLSRHP